MSRVLTVEEVKDELPDCKVWEGGREWPARVVGRKNKFATVCWGDEWHLTATVAWETLTDSINNGRPIKVSGPRG